MENDNRPLGLRMGYESMWSLLDNVSTIDINNEIIRFKEELKKRYQDIRERQNIIDTINSKMSVLEKVSQERYKKTLIQEFKLTDEHIKLIRSYNFSNFDIVPYISGSYEDLAKLLSWELPNEYVSKEQEIKLKKLIDELPLALNEIINK